ncbi:MULTISPECIES: hypothetical protein [unclassified Pseudomonas]|uniref:hypothetical protein n=1 Tax=unclassified Pseudomonas TaxID=196821 RepID=UPI0035C0934C
MNDSVPEPLTDSLTCTLPLELLSQIAARLDAATFALLLRPIFGSSLPPGLFVKLRKDLAAEAVASPALRIKDDQDDFCVFDPQTQSIDIKREALDLTLEYPEQNAQLLMALIAAFALYIDARVRGYFAEAQADDATQTLMSTPADLGAQFTEFLLFYANPIESDTVFAHYTRSGDEHRLLLTKVERPTAVAFVSGKGEEKKP